MVEHHLHVVAGERLVYWDETTEWMSDAVGATTIHSSPPTEAGNACIRSSDIQLRGRDRNWTTDGAAAGGNVLYTFNVLAHEVGHFLGLGHSEDTGALMYAYGQAAPQVLNEDDIAGVCALYGAAGSVQDCSVEGCANDMFCREGQCIAAGARCGGPFGCDENQACIELNVFSYCPDACDFRVSSACANPERFCSPRMGDGSVGYCMPGKPGDLSDGAPCAEDYDCASGLCEQGFCRTACANHDCPAGTYCTATDGVGACAPVLAFGAACDESAACLSGLCFDDDTYGSAYCSASCAGEATCPEGSTCLASKLCGLAPADDADAGANTEADDGGLPLPGAEDDSKDAGGGTTPDEPKDPPMQGGDDDDGPDEVLTEPPPLGMDGDQPDTILGATSGSDGGCSVPRAGADGALTLAGLSGLTVLLRRRRGRRAP